MLFHARSQLALATMVAMSAACGDESSPFVDAGNDHGQDASPADGAVSIDAGDVDARGIDAASPDAPVVIDASPTPDASTQNATWRGAQPLESLTGSARLPVAGMDGAGRAFVAWRNEIQDPENEGWWWGEVRVSRFDPATGWGDAIALSPAPIPRTSFANGLDLAVGPQGDAMVLWYQYNGTNDVDVMVRRFTPTGGWSVATVLFDASNTPASGAPAIAIAADGSAIAMWSQRGGDLNLDSQLYARRFTPSGGWEPSMPVHVVPGGDAIADDVAFDANGHAVAAWTLHQGGSTVWASRFSGTSWSTPVRIDQGENDAGPADLAVDAAGNAIAVFESVDSRGHGIWAARGTADGAWQLATRLEDASRYANFSHVDCDATGNAIAVWQSWPADGLASPHIRSRRFTSSGGWGAITPVETFAENASSPQVAMTPTGNATVAFVSNGAIWANRFAGGTWGTPTRISSTGTGAYDDPVVAAGGLDSAVAAWPFDPMPVDGHPTPFDLWANVYR